MANNLDVFTPDTVGTVGITSSAASGRVAIMPNRSQYTITNTGTDSVFVAFGDVTVAATKPSGATGGSYPIGPGVVQTIGVQPIAGVMPTHCAVIGNSATACIVYISAGSGF